MISRNSYISKFHRERKRDTNTMCINWAMNDEEACQWYQTKLKKNFLTQAQVEKKSMKNRFCGHNLCKSSSSIDTSAT